MRILFAIVAAFVVVTVRAQNKQESPAPTPPLRNSIESEIRREAAQPPGESPLFLRANPANQMNLDGLTVDGILVQMAKDNPLELINPAAPPEYGSPADNVTWSLTGQRVTGLKLFAIQF